MSTVAAVVFSFVFTTSANANTNAGTPQKSSLEIRVKDAPKRNVGIRVKGAQKGNVEIRVKDAPNNSFENFLDQVLGIRVKVRVQNQRYNNYAIILFEVGVPVRNLMKEQWPAKKEEQMPQNRKHRSRL